jgi:hypothetical protein
MEKKERKLAKQERWTKKCPSCVERWRKLLTTGAFATSPFRAGMGEPEDHASYIPDDYEICDGCLADEYELDTEHDALDHMGLVDLCTKDLAIRAIRWANGETYVR